VRYCPVHEGHECDMSYLQPRKNKRKQATQMQEIQMQEIQIQDIQMQEIQVARLIDENELKELQHNLNSMQEHYTYIYTASQYNLDIASMACKQLARVKSSIIAYQNKTDGNELQPTSDPVPIVKKTGRQRKFPTKKKTSVIPAPTFTIPAELIFHSAYCERENLFLGTTVETV
jgi:hypothetical protein